MPTHIAVINEATVFSDAEAQALIGPLQTQWNRDLLPIWFVDDARLVWVPKGKKPPAGYQWLVFLDDSDQAGALAYHDLTDQGLPLSKVFCKTILDASDSISVAASHELLEMAVDPWLNIAAQDPKGTFWAQEIADPVEDQQYGYMIDNVRVSDFVTPDWFAHKASSKHLDFGHNETAPFQILSGGYAQYFDASAGGWQQVTGDRVTSARALHPVPGSRRERRIRQFREPLQLSAPREEIEGA